MFAVQLLSLLSLALGLVRAVTALTARNTLLDVSTIFQCKEVGTWIENVATRENGDLLFTMVEPTPQLYTVIDPSEETRTTELIYEFPNMTGLLGIAESAHDVFAVVGGSFYSTANPVLGSFSIWTVDLNHVDSAAITKIMDLPYEAFPNGLEAVPGETGVVMLASSLGALYRVDLNTRTCVVAAELPEMRPVSGAILPLGINGIKIRDGHLYWTNSFASTIYRIPIDAHGIVPESSSAEVVATLPGTFLDDFAMGPDGTMWVTTNPNNTVVAVNSDGKKMEIVAGSQQSSDTAGVIAAAFGRTRSDQQILYAVTSGGLVG
ncbi:hypothetical protein TruAng_008017 [Truncatella angustata]|nr:hypothetical protein TruAng_008017 [Truncatella angustata]